MNSGLKALLLLIAIAAAGFGAYALLGNDTLPPGPTVPPGIQEPVKPDPGDQLPVKPLVVEDNPPEKPPVTRTEIDNPIESGSDYPQGVRGRVVSRIGQPIIGAEVELFRGHGMRNLLEQMMAMQKGVVQLAVATVRTAADGTFDLGVKRLGDGDVFELRVRAENHADFNRGQITVFEGKWWDAGIITLEPGLTLQGRVTAAQTGAPIADATVLMKSLTQGFGFSNMANDSAGTAITTDLSGSFRFTNATPGMVVVTAFGPGYARVENNQVQVREDVENVVDFSLPPGLALDGIVTDAGGAPVPGASYQVVSIAPKSPLNVSGGTDREGRFEVLGLVEGPYQIIVTAEGFTRKDEKPVMAGESGRQIVLEKQGAVRVKVVARNGRLIKRYSINRKSWHAASEMPGNMLGAPQIRVNDRDLDNGWYTVSGWDPGAYMLEIHVPGYAMAFSSPFNIAVGSEVADLTVEVSDGGSLAGTVVGADGRPLGGVRITTQTNEWEDNPIQEIFGVMAPAKISMMDIRTGENGEFRMEKLTPGTYQLLFQHPEHTTTSVRDIEIVEGQRTDLQPVQLVQGTQVLGIVMVDGVPAAQVKVQVSTAPDPSRKDGRGLFSANAISDDLGQFVIPKRLPPGRYMSNAGRQGSPFLMVVDYQQTKQEFEVLPGQVQHRLQFQIRTQ